MEETQLHDPDAPPANALDSIFVLPDEIASDPRILGWYNEMVRQLRQEASGVPMKAAQYTLMERIAFTYASMRYQEFTNPDMPDRARQALIDSWQKMIDQFNRLLEKNNDKIVMEMMIQIETIIKNELPVIKDEADRNAFLRNLSAALAKVEM